MERIDPKKLEEWKMLLTAPLPWESEEVDDAPALWDDEAEAAAWESAFSTVGG